MNAFGKTSSAPGVSRRDILKAGGGLTIGLFLGAPGDAKASAGVPGAVTSSAFSTKW